VDLIHPASNDILLFINRGSATDEKEWAVVRRSAVTLAESANLLMARGRARDQGDWMKDAQMLAGVGAAAYKAAQEKDTKASRVGRTAGRVLHRLPQTISAQRVSP